MRINTACIAAAALAVGATGATTAQAQEELTLCWAAWDPANALVELSKDFTAETGIGMKFEFVPWPNFADRMLNELNSGGQLCDLLIGDSQWIGGGAENEHYVKLNDFFDAEGISMDDFAPATVYAYSTWPKGTPNYYALPAMGDANAWFYRKDWFAKPELREEFKATYGRELEPPTTQLELKDIAEFFQGRDIDGTTVYGAAIYTERGSEGITMGVTNALYNYGFVYENPANPYELDGYVNSAGAVEGLEFYKALYDCCTPPGSSDWYMSENIDAYKSGQVAMQMNFAFIWPGVHADPNVGGDRSGYFPNPAGPGGHFAQLGGQ
ncbi:MAG: extracellular solute-binding protein, partial [Pseudomonadota bacterium]